MTECVVCGGELALQADTVLGELVDCDECGCELEVTSVGPFAVREAPQEAEDWGQ